MKDITIEITDRIIFNVEGEQYSLSPDVFFKLVSTNGEWIRGEIRRFKERFNGQRRPETVARIDAMIIMGRTHEEISAKLGITPAHLTDFLETQGDFLTAIRASGDYQACYRVLMAEPNLI